MTKYLMLPTMLALAIALAAEATVANETASPRVGDLAGAEWHRVQGPAYGGSVLDVGPSGSWYDSYVGFPTVHFDGELYRMWFVGGQKTSTPGVPYGRYERIGLATSRDGVNWQLANEGQPVLNLGPSGGYDSKGVSHPFVLRVGGTFMMWYAAIDGTTAGDLGLSPASVRVERVSLATSPDGIQWTRANGGNPVMNIGPPGSIDAIQTDGMTIVQTAGTFKMWYGAYNGLHTIGTATSPDGITWTKTNGGQSVAGLSGSQQLGPTVYFDGQTNFLAYTRILPANNGGSIWVTSAATSQDGFNWAPVSNGAPLLNVPAPANNFVSADGVATNNHSVHPSQIIVENGLAHMWYMGENSTGQRIGLMEASLNVPEPSTLVLLATGLLGLLCYVWRKRK